MKRAAPKLRIITGILLILFISTAASADTITLRKRNPAPSVPLGYDRLMLLNTIAPGTAQFLLDKPLEGLIYSSALPLTITGGGLIIYSVYNEWAGLRFRPHKAQNGLNYLTEFAAYPEAPASSNRAILATGIGLFMCGNMFSAYSAYAAHRDYTDIYGLPEGELPVRDGRDSLGSLLLAPFTPRHVLTPEVLSYLTVSSSLKLASADLSSLKGYFSRKTVPIGSAQVSPAAGFFAHLGYAAAIITVKTAAEEIFYRGYVLEKNGNTSSAIQFGLSYIPNALLPETSVEHTVLKSTLAAGSGYYSGSIAENNLYHLHKSIALNWWSSLFDSIISYTANPETTFPLGIGIKFSY